MSTRTEEILAIHGLNKSYGHVDALRGLEFVVKRGDIYGFLGPNGSGKSTTIRILLSLVKPDSGTINVFGESLSENRNDILSRIGALVERPDFYEHLSALRNLTILNNYSNAPVGVEKIKATLELVGLAGRMKDHVKTYSDGMKQRLGIAQALMHDPELLILDEPFNSLDPQGVKDVRELIVTLNQKKGTTFLVSSHKLDEIEKIATRMVLINKGKAIAEGDVQDLIHQGDTAINIKLDDPVKAKQILVQSHLDLKVIEAHDTFLSVYSNKNHIPEIIQVLSNSGVLIYGVTDNHSLEQLFLSLT